MPKESNKKVHLIYSSIIAGLLLLIAFTSWQLLSYSLMYQTNVDYCSELSFSYGYSFALKQDTKNNCSDFHHRLSNTEYKDGVLSVEIWPAKKQWLFFENPRTVDENKGMVDCYVGKKK